MLAKTVEWVGRTNGFLLLIDQRKLPAEFVKIECHDIDMVSDAIKTLAVRGAPAIGVAAAYGVVLGLQKLADSDSLKKGTACLEQACDYLSKSRPTAVNLFWALERVKNCRQKAADLMSLKKCVLAEAETICREDIQMCKRIGENGQGFIKDGMGVLTHCNAGALATAGQGTALSVLFEAHKNGKNFKVFADETRPLLQGARLTAWELEQAGIDVTVICDNMAGWLMKERKIDMVITGADRIAANGDTANKIGTYSLSILAKEHKIPFYVAAPSNTFDLSIENGEKIPIEQRNADEIRFFNDKQIVPAGVGVYNPAFDITSAENITAIITECGVIEKPAKTKIISNSFN